VTEAKVESVMGAYNRTLHEVCCASKLLLDDILRGEWGFQGMSFQTVWRCPIFISITRSRKMRRILRRWL
jgi:hypothetical protein